MPSKIPDLKFGPTGSSTGFTSSGVSSFSDLKPEAVVRELIQNSLDAAVDAGVRRAEVRFHLSNAKIEDIPGIKSYRLALDAAEKAQSQNRDGELAAQEQLIVNRIRSALDEDAHDVLSVIDNGYGLDERRMHALLSDGVSVKSEGAAGTHGVGHTSVIPTSNLRYILYGGLLKTRARLVSGHAILASHADPKSEKQQRCSEDGFLIRGFTSGTEAIPHEYDQGGHEDTKLIDDELNEIAQRDNSGTAIIIPCFNNFLENEDLCSMVFKAVACHFFPAIADGFLAVFFKDSRDAENIISRILDRDTLHTILNEYKEQSRATRGGFLNGKRAFDGYTAFLNGEKEQLETEVGSVRIILYQSDDIDTTRIDLFRNGMWITDGLPRLSRGEFGRQQPFHALMLLDNSDSSQFYRLVQDAESPLHNQILVKKLSREDKRLFNKAVLEIRGWFIDKVPEMTDDSFSPSGILELSGDGASGIADGEGPVGMGRPVAFPTNTPAPTGPWKPSVPPGPPDPPGPHPPKPPFPKPRSRPVAHPWFKAVVVPRGENKRRIHIQCQESCERAELRLYLDENVDATCDSQRRDELTPVLLRSVTVNGNPVSRDDFAMEAEELVAVRLGNLESASILNLDVEFSLPSDVILPADQIPAIRVEIHRTHPSTAC